MVGTRFGPYSIVAPLGAGGMGEVYRAKDTRLDRTVAIKILSPGSGSPRQTQRFAREARAVSKVNHPHICTLYDIGEQDGVQFIVMECLEGETLAQRIQRGALRSIKSSAMPSRLPTPLPMRTVRGWSTAI